VVIYEVFGGLGEMRGLYFSSLMFPITLTIIIINPRGFISVNGHFTVCEDF